MKGNLTSRHATLECFYLHVAGLKVWIGTVFAIFQRSLIYLHLKAEKEIRLGLGALSSMWNDCQAFII